MSRNATVPACNYRRSAQPTAVGIERYSTARTNCAWSLVHSGRRRPRREARESLLHVGDSAEVIVPPRRLHRCTRVRASTRPHAAANFANRPVMVSSLRDDLSVTSLADVEIVPAIGGPAHEHVGGTLNHALAVDYSLTVVTVGAVAHEPLIHRRDRLLDLQE